MPRYDYKCTSCSDELELTHSLFDETEKICPNCDGHLIKTFHPTPVVFKGNGWGGSHPKP